MKHLLLLLALALCSALAAAQQRSVSGTIRDQAGNPLPGVAVMVPGTTNGVVTDIDGRYTIMVDGSPKLSATFIGMVPAEIDLAAGQTDATMSEEQREVSEVVVVAFGTTTKQAFTGSAAVVGAEDLEKRTTSNVANQLAGQVPGLQMRAVDGAPGSEGGDLQIRGVSSLYASTSPLVIVDGAPYPGNLSDIPSNEIESVTVLKDAASAALYGARGASGVVLITTRKGGKAAEGQINVEAKWGVNSRAVQDYDVITDPGEYYEAYYAQLYNKYFYSDGLSAAAANAKANKDMLTHLGYQSMSVPQGEKLIGADGKINPKATKGFTYVGGDGVTYYVYPDDWTDAAYSTSPRQEYTVNAQGGNEKGSYFVSVGYLNDEGIIEYTGYKRFAARLKADYQVKKWFKAGANIGYVNSKTTSNANMSYGDDVELGEANLMYFVSSIAPIYPIYVRGADGQVMVDANGNPIYDFNRKEFALPPAEPKTDYTMVRGFLDGNPLGANRYNESVTLTNGLNGNLSATINFTQNLKLDVTSSLILNHRDASTYENPLYGSKRTVGGYLYRLNELYLRQNHVQTLNYFNTFDDVHNLTVLVGHEYYRSKRRLLDAKATGSFSPEIKELDAFATKTDNGSSTGRYNVEGWFGNVQYNYDQKYFLQGSYRRDASSRFASDNKWGDFWSAGAAWIVSKENFMASTADVIDELKLKYSIGQQGNDNIKDFAYTDLYSLSKGSNDAQMVPTFYRVGNPDITWETVTNTNIGVEFSLWKHRLVGNVDYFSKKTQDLLFWLSIPESSGSRGYYGNMGDIRNRGFELQLTGSVIRTEDLDWSISANLSHFKTEILELPETKIIGVGGFYEDGLWYEEGGELYNYMTFAYAGVDPLTGNALYWYDEDLSPLGNAASNNVGRPGKKRSGKTDDISKASRYAHGSNLPDLFGGFSTSLKWKGLDVSATFDYQIGGKIYDTRYASLMSPAASTRDAGQNYHKDWVRSWSPNNTSSDIPRWQYGDQYTTNASDRFLTDASYLNFSSFVVGYTLPKQVSERILMSKIRVYVAGENLTFLSAREGLDPRYSYSANEQVSNYSPVRTISGGVQLSF